MRLIILPILFFISTFLFSQGSSELIYTQKFYADNFYNQLSRSNNFTFNTAPRYIGIQNSGNIALRKGSHLHSGCAISASQMIPADITINDSLKAKLTGSNFGIAFFGIDLFKKQRNFDFIITTGANMGRLKIYDNKLFRSKNGYFSPKAMVLIKVNIKRIYLVASGEYDYDVSSSKWKNLKYGSERKLDPNSFKQSCYSFSFGLGYSHE